MLQGIQVSSNGFIEGFRAALGDVRGFRCVTDDFSGIPGNFRSFQGDSRAF